ncbi:translation initiation factor IF-3 [Candidatus Arthromitus sp. SFB-mouse-Japan]|nr:translation initiation factor IF-3 [Candidatus Arthromitus sp. SFB-mouse-Japan]
MIFKFVNYLEVANIAKDVQINGEIKFKELRVIDSDGSQLGIMQARDALRIAEDRELDLVVISPTANPPVSRIMDYGKHVYELSKRQKEARKNQKTINIKEIRVSPSIEEHDINIKANNAKKFLKSGDKVKITVRFRGREADYSYIGEKILDNFVEILKEYGAPDKKAKLEGRNMSLIMSPKK